MSYSFEITHNDSLVSQKSLNKIFSAESRVEGLKLTCLCELSCIQISKALQTKICFSLVIYPDLIEKFNAKTVFVGT